MDSPEKRYELKWPNVTQATTGPLHNCHNFWVRQAIPAALVALILSGCIACADSDDDDFLRALHKQGITNQFGDQGLINLGHEICYQRAEGYTESAVMSMGKLRGNKMTDQDVKVIVNSAESAYCPEYIQ